MQSRTTVTLTAKPASKNISVGWSGACEGAQLTCDVTVTDAMNVTATFAATPAPVGGGGGGGGGRGGGNATPQFTLSIGRGGSGTATGLPAGIDCGKNCSAKYAQGTAVTLTATPAAGLHFINWTGACSGTAPTCNVSITKDTQVQAIFK